MQVHVYTVYMYHWVCVCVCVKYTYWIWASLVVQMVKNLPAMQETYVQSLCGEDPLEEGTATHASIPAWRIPWTEELSGLQSMESQSQTYNLACMHMHASVYIVYMCVYATGSVSLENPNEYRQSGWWPLPQTRRAQDDSVGHLCPWTERTSLFPTLQTSSPWCLFFLAL